MYRTFALLALVFAGAAALPAADPPKSAAPAPAKAIAPLVDAQTLVVARVDLRRFETAGVFPAAAPLLKASKEAVAEAQAKPRAWQQAFRKAGGTDLYAVYGGNDFPGLPCLLAPAGDGADRKELAKLLGELLPDGEPTSATESGFLCVGPKAAVERFKKVTPAERPELAAAFEAVADSPVQILFLPTADFRKVYEEVAPTLPKELGGGSIRTLTRGLRWAALGVSAPPELRTQLTVQAADADAAKKLAAVWSKAMEAAGNQTIPEAGMPLARANPKFFKRLTEVLTPKVEGDRLVIDQPGGKLVGEFAKLTKELPSPADRAMSSNNLKQIALAMHNYHDANGQFPTDVRDKDGKLLLSWRVHLLPYLEQAPLYNEFKMNEPWDSEHNKKLIARMPRVYRSPRQGPATENKTTYLGVSGKGAVFGDPKGLKIVQITDGTSNTIMIVETNDDGAVIWSKPGDWQWNPKSPTKGLLGHYGNDFLAAFADGSVRFIKGSTDPNTLNALFTVAGGEPVSLP